MGIKIKTKVAVSVNNSMLGATTTMVIGELEKIEMSSDFNTYVITYNYRRDDSTLIKSDSYILENEEIDNTYLQIKSLLPTNYDTLTEREQQNIKYETAFKFIMADTFTIDLSDIETYVD